MQSSNVQQIKFSRRSFLVAACVSAVAVPVSDVRPASAAGWFDVYATTVWDDFTNVRSEPDEQADILTEFGPGTTVMLLDGPTANGWYLVQSVDGNDGTTGWGAGWLLIFEQRAQLVEDLPFYDQPGSWSIELGWIRHGFVVTLLSPIIDEYVLAQSGGRSGFVSIWSLEPSWEDETNPSSEWWVDVNRSTAEVRLYVGASQVDRFDASVSKDLSEGFYATAIGTYWIYQKIEELTYTPFAEAYFRYWAGFDEERYNGFHSWTMNADGDVLNGGWGTTAGCVSTEPSDAASIFNFVEIGTRVEIHW